MLDFNNILATPGADIQYFSGPATGTVLQWQVWKKPRGARWIYMLGVGGGGGGSCGNAAAVSTGGGGAGGSSGNQTTVMIPAMFVPDVLYIQAGAGGAGATTSAGFGTNGIATYVAIVPYTTLSPAGTILVANPGLTSATAPTTSNGGLAPTAQATGGVAGSCLAGRGFYSFLVGQVGGAGGAANAGGPTVNLPTTGLMVTAGSGGGGVGSGQGGTIGTTGFLGTEFFPLLQGGVTGGRAAESGFIARNFLMNYGGTGGAGGGGGSQGTAGSNGAPGCGGGGGGGASNSFPTIAPAGSGGPGFVYIFTI